MAKLPFLRGFTQLKFAGSAAGVTAPGETDSVAALLTPADERRNEVPALPPIARVLVVLDGALTNTDISVSVLLTDSNDVTGASEIQTQQVRALPSGTKVVAMFTFPTLRMASLTAVLESEITGGATAKIYVAFQDEN